MWQGFGASEIYFFNFLFPNPQLYDLFQIESDHQQSKGKKKQNNIVFRHVENAFTPEDDLCCEQHNSRRIKHNMTNGCIDSPVCVGRREVTHTQCCGKVLRVVYWSLFWGHRVCVCSVCVCVCSVRVWVKCWICLKGRLELNRNKIKTQKGQTAVLEENIVALVKYHIIFLNICHNPLCLQISIHVLIIFFCRGWNAQPQLKLGTKVASCVRIFFNLLFISSINVPVSCRSLRFPKLNSLFKPLMIPLRTSFIPFIIHCCLIL